MGAIYDVVMGKAKVTYETMTKRKKGEESINIDSEISNLDSIATSMADAEMSKIEAEYDAKTKALPESINARKAKYRLERFNSDDKEKYGDNGIKLSFNDLMALLNKDADEVAKEDQKKNEEKMQKNAEENSVQRISQEKSEENQRKSENEKRNKDAKEKLAKEHPEDLLLRAHSVAKLAEYNVENFEKTKKSAYKDEEEKVDGEAKLLGYALGAQDVQNYNNELKKQAKSIIDKKRKAEVKIKIMQKKLEQTVKLQIGAMLGL